MAKKTTKKTAKKKTAAKKTAIKTEPKHDEPEVTPHPTADHISEFEKAIDLKLGKTDNAQGRPSKQQTETQAKENQAAEAGVSMSRDVLAKGVKCPFAMWAEMQGDENLKAKLKLADDEARDLADALLPLMAYYSGDIKPVVMLWAVAGLNAMAIMTPRAAAIGQARREKRRTAQVRAAQQQKQQPSFYAEPSNGDGIEPTGPTGFPRI